MKNLFQRGVFLLMCAILAYSSTALSADIRMAFGVSLPPYVIAKSNVGIEVDIIREALAHKGHNLIPVYVPLARVPVHFERGKVDATQRDGGSNLVALGAHYGDTSVAYHAAFFSLAERGLKIEKPSDLEGLKVISFQNAVKQSRFKDWLQPVADAGNYFEINDQLSQVKTLQVGRYDVVLADRNIFAYFTLKLRDEGNITIKPTALHEFLQPHSYKPLFRDEAVKDDFNVGIKHLHATGRYQQIIDSYVK